MGTSYVGECYLCGGTEHACRADHVRDDETIDVLECRRCGLVFLSRTELPDGFYEDSGMHGEEAPSADEILRHNDRDDERRYHSLAEAMTNKDLLDFGCGAGGFLLKARSKARSVVGVELETRLQPHFQANHLDVETAVEHLPEGMTFDLITAFHVVEHLEDPAGMLRLLATRLRGEASDIVIEVPSPSDALLTVYDSAAFSDFTYWSCHLYLFDAPNMARLAEKAGLRLKYVNHIQRYPLSNHLFWLANGKPGGHQIWSFLDSPELASAYEARLAALGVTDTIVAGLSL